MNSKKHQKPDFFKALMAPGFYEEANATIKFHESEGFWVFKTGPHVYKVIKPAGTGTSKLLLEAYAQEMAANANRYSPGLECCALSLMSQGDQWSLVPESAPGSADYYVLKERQLSDRGFIHHLLEKDKLKQKHLEQIAQALWAFHETAGMAGTKGLPDADELKERLNDRYYQAKKYLGKTITKTMIDLSSRPLEKAIEEHRKLFGRRTRKGFIGHYHGDMMARKIHWSAEQVNFLGRSGDPMKDRYGDRASDVADLCVDLEAAGKPELAQAFTEHYVLLSGDKELSLALPVYKALKAMKLGLKHSVLLEHSEDPEADQATARHFFELVVGWAADL